MVLESWKEFEQGLDWRCVSIPPLTIAASCLMPVAVDYSRPIAALSCPGYRWAALSCPLAALL